MRDLVLALEKLPDSDLLGLSDGEIHEVCEDQGLERLPQCYVEFLRLMGRKAGRVFRGTDAFYPEILGLKNDALDLLVQNGVEDLMGSDAAVFAMHQGYQVIWMVNSDDDDPSVVMYQEGDQGLSKQWRSFTAFLRDEVERLAAT